MRNLKESIGEGIFAFSSLRMIIGSLFLIAFIIYGCKFSGGNTQSNTDRGLEENVKLHSSRHPAAKVAALYIKYLQENKCKEAVFLNFDGRKKITTLKFNAPPSQWGEIEESVVREEQEVCNKFAQSLQHAVFHVDEKVLEQKTLIRNKQGEVIGEEVRFVVYGTIEFSSRENSFLVKNKDGLVRITTLRINVMLENGELLVGGLKSLGEYDVMWPNDEQTRIVVARRHVSKGDKDKALAALGSVNTQEGKELRAAILYKKSLRNVLGRVQYYPSSMREMKEALRLDPSLKENLRGYGCALIRSSAKRGFPDTATKNLRKLREFLPGESCGLNLLVRK